MDLVLLGLAIVLVGVVAAVAVGWIRGGLDPATVNRAEVRLPAGTLRPQDIAALRFTVALRGYRMDEVDGVLDRLIRELADNQATIAELRRQIPTTQNFDASSSGAGSGAADQS